jgi:hypothetical protein
VSVVVVIITTVVTTVSIVAMMIGAVVVVAAGATIAMITEDAATEGDYGRQKHGDKKYAFHGWLR